ncbi:hypothetical protein [Endozoicomonas numazuensis]|uniref:Fido domain-containing protein n=1 Tax=Endozoicomonas numazuensis TaxID=1137799 RepID=A0A081N3X9_9GAMM|nr:hypothetical protein [Endozoicomonas numazuensis]KEQ13152.1 hypothetical protein GZ78_26775 [Endozoicomonas numazuensis]
MISGIYSGAPAFHAESSDFTGNSDCSDTSKPYKREATLVSHRKVAPINRVTSNPKTGLERLKKFPTTELPRLLVDGCLLSREKGVEAYEKREPGCLKNLMAGWTFIVNSLKSLKAGEPPVITHEFLLTLHSIVAAHLERANAGHYISEQGAFYLVPLCHEKHNEIQLFDPAGLKEAEVIHKGQCNWYGEQDAMKKAKFQLRLHGEKGNIYIPITAQEIEVLIKHQDNPVVFHSCFRVLLMKYPGPLKAFYDDLLGSSSKGDSKKVLERREKALNKVSESVRKNVAAHIKSQTLCGEFIKDCISDILHRLNLAMNSDLVEEDFFRAVSCSIAKLELVHPFASVNGRTFTLLLQYLLLAHGYPPATLEMPELFSFHEREVMVNALKKGLESSEKLLSSSSPSSEELHNFKAVTADPSYFALCMAMTDIVGKFDFLDAKEEDIDSSSVTTEREFKLHHNSVLRRKNGSDLAAACRQSLMEGVDQSQHDMLNQINPNLKQGRLQSLMGVDLKQGACLKGINFSSGVTLNISQGQLLKGYDSFKNVEFERCDFSHLGWQTMSFEGSKLKDCLFSGASLSWEGIKNASFSFTDPGSRTFATTIELLVITALPSLKDFPDEVQRRKQHLKNCERIGVLSLSSDELKKSQEIVENSEKSAAAGAELMKGRV